MPYFFNGRLNITPAVLSRIDTSALANTNLTVGNTVAIMGISGGGEPNTPLVFGSPSEAGRVLRSGELLTAVQKAFAPSSETNAPAQVIAMRVNPATQSLGTLFDATPSAVIELASDDYGLYTSQIKYKVESGTNVGKKITTQYGESFYVGDDIARNALSVQYLGAEASATITVDNTQVVLAAPAGTTVATIALATYPTVQNLVDAINAVTDFSAAVADANGQRPALNGLDSVTTQDVKTDAYTVTADLQAVVDFFNSNLEGYLTATRKAGAGAPPANVDWTYLSGGVDGVTTVQHWSDALTTLQAEDVQWIAALTKDAAVHAMVDAHCHFMSDVARMERRAFVGGDVGQDNDTALAAAKALNSDRTSYVGFGYYDFDESGALKLFPPYMMTAILAGAFAGVDPGEALTNKSVSIRGVERKLTVTDTDALISGRVLCVNNTPTGFRVVQSISTWLNDDNYYRVEVSVGAAGDFTARNLREALQSEVGAKGSPLTLAEIVSRADSALRLLSTPAPQGPGVLVGDADNPPFKNLSASLQGDVIAVQVQCSPVIPVNYIPISIYAVPFSGTATA